MINLVQFNGFFVSLPDGKIVELYVSMSNSSFLKSFWDDGHDKFSKQISNRSNINFYKKDMIKIYDNILTINPIIVNSLGRLCTSYSAPSIYFIMSRVGVHFCG